MKKTEGKEFKRHKTTFFLFLILFWLMVPSQSLLSSGEQAGLLDESLKLSETQISEIEEYIRGQMKRGKIPGLSVVIVKGDRTIYKNGFGFANIKKKQPITAKTLFEIGSNSKAFTALGILLLQEKGKLKLDDPVDKYMPWFKMKYKGKEVPITIEQLLHHTSGIPFETVADIPQSGDDNALEETVRTLINKELSYQPGHEFSFATINYDVLGLIIEKVSGQSFEEFMENNILEPLGLTSTYLSRNEAMAHEMVTGYKIEFLAPREYKAPVYRGHTPAGYFITNIDEMDRWIKIQMDTIELSGPFRNIIRESHKPNEKVIGFRYAKGWFIFKGREIFHSGNNPNFSSFIVLSMPKGEPGKEGDSTQKKVGIAVLANINSGIVEESGWGILAILKREEYIPEKCENFYVAVMTSMNPSFFNGIAWGILALIKKANMPVQSRDFYIKLDMISCIAICIVTSLLIVSIWLIFGSVKRILKKRIKFEFIMKIMGVYAAITLVLIVILYLISDLPMLLSYDLPWNVIDVWGPKTLKMAAILVAVNGFLFYIYFFFKFFFPKPKNNMNELEDKK